jgi:long-chain acyl-CoA synthetase
VTDTTAAQPGPNHLVDVLKATVERDPGRIIFGRRDGSGWRDVSAKEFLDDVTALAKGFVASGVGVGDRVGIMSKTRYEWTLCDFALWSIAAIPVPIYETSSVDQVEWILADAQAVGCVVETKAHSWRLSVVRDRVPGVKHLWQIEPGDGVPGLGALVEAGHEVSDEELANRQQALSRNVIATLIYTSGTTGRPKGCMLTHGNFIDECSSALSTLPELFERPDASTLLFLPLAHVFGRMIQVAVVMKGVKLSHSDPARLVKDLAAVQPTFVLSVPQVFEKVFETARRKATADGRGSIFERAASTAIAYSEAYETGKPGAMLAMRHAVFDKLVYSKLRAALGGNCDLAISGGAPLGARLAHFYRGIGVTVLEGYGLTETTAAASVNTVDAQRIGTVGRALKGFEVRIGEDGEVLLRGGHVFGGYWRNESATAQVLDAEGWLHTGDLGSLDADGYLTITGRLKEIIVTAGGKNVAPAALEDVVRAHPIVAQAMVVGDQRNFVAALVTLDQESLDQWMDDQGRPRVPLAEVTHDEQVRAAVQTSIDAANETVSGAEQIRRFEILAVEWTEDSGHLTPTMKLKRSKVMDDFSREVESLYASRV